MNMIETMIDGGYNMENSNSSTNDMVIERMGLINTKNKDVKKKILTYFKKMIGYIYKNNLGDTDFGWAALIIINNVLLCDGDWKKYKFKPSEIHTKFDNELAMANNDHRITINNLTDYYTISKIYQY